MSNISLDIENRHRLTALVGALLSGKYGMTDIYIASNEPVMVRLSSSVWAAVTDSNGLPHIYEQDAIRAFVNGIFLGEETSHPTRPPAWDDVLKRMGSLHPAAVLNTEVDGVAQQFRVRCTIQRQAMGASIGLVIRALAQNPPVATDLGLPIWLSQYVGGMTSGLVVVTGPTGSGKSTTLASMLEHINQSRTAHILTIEDPIEFEFDRKRSIISQREIQVDVPTFAQGVKDALRFVPDVILVGETRDSDTMQSVLRAAESGHLVMTSMHAPSALMAIGKMQALLAANTADINALSNSLAVVIAQALVRSESGQNLLVYEILNCRDKTVQSFIMSGQNTEAAAVRSKISARQIEHSVSWQERLRSLVRDNQLTPRQAAQLAQEAEEKREFSAQAMQSMQKG